MRFIPTDEPGPATFSNLPADASLGLGEVHEVPYDSAILDLPDDQRRMAILDWLQKYLLQLAATLAWDTKPLIDAYEACKGERCHFSLHGAAKTSPDRRHKAHVEYEIDGDGDGWSWVVVTDHKGRIEAVSRRHDSPASITRAGKALRSLRWDDNAATWMPWTDDVAPRGHDNWLGRVERFPIGGDDL